MIQTSILKYFPKSEKKSKAKGKTKESPSEAVCEELRPKPRTRALPKSRKRPESSAEDTAKDSQLAKKKFQKTKWDSAKDNEVSRMVTRQQSTQSRTRLESNTSEKEEAIKGSEVCETKIQAPVDNVKDSEISCVMTRQMAKRECKTLAEAIVERDNEDSQNMTVTQPELLANKDTLVPDDFVPKEVLKFGTVRLLQKNACSSGDPKKMTTYELLANPSVLKAALNELTDLKERDFLSGKHEEDILKNEDRNKDSKGTEENKDSKGTEENKDISNLDNPPSAPSATKSDQSHHSCNVLVEELRSRFNDNDDFDSDNSESSSFMTKSLSLFFPGYAQKKAAYDKHSKMIKELNGADLTEHFEDFKDELMDIFQEKAVSVRHKLYTEGKLQELREMGISIPFESVHGMIIISLAYDFLFPIKDEYSLKHSDYISCVILPECFIRIYSRVTGLNYLNSQLELQYGAKYDDYQLEETKPDAKN